MEGWMEENGVETILRPIVN